MKIQFDAAIRDMKDQPLKDGGEEVKLSTVTAAAMLMALPEDNALDGDRKIKMFRIAQAATKGGEQDVSVEDVALLKQRIAKIYGALIVGRVFDLIEGNG